MLGSIPSLKDFWGTSPSASLDALDRTHQQKKELLLQLRHCRDDLLDLHSQRKTIDQRIRSLDVRRQQLQRKLRESMDLDRTECQRFVDAAVPPMATVVAASDVVLGDTPAASVPTSVPGVAESANTELPAT